MRMLRITAISAIALAIGVAAIAWGAAGSAKPVHAGGGGCLASYAAGFFGFEGDSLTTAATGAPNPYAVAGAIFLTADSTTSLTGTVSGYETINNKGVVSRVTFTGTYAMATGQCIGSAVLTTSALTTLHYDLVPVGWSNGGIPTHVLFVQTDKHTIGTLTATAM